MDEALRMANHALYMIMLLSMAPLVISLVVGLIISLFQALTQIQEQTLTFVPKVIATAIIIMLTFEWTLREMTILMNEIFELILKVGAATGT